LNKLRLKTTYYELCVLLVCLVLCACAVSRPASLEEHNKALQLIDESVAYLRMGKLNRAQSGFETAVELAPLPAGWDGLGCVYLLKGNLLKAERYFHMAYEMDNAYQHSLGNLAMLYEIAGKPERAYRIYLRAIGENPDNFRFRNNFAVFLHDNPAIGKDRKALVSKELSKARALEQNPLIESNLRQIK